jgi:hypothetical protein
MKVIDNILFCYDYDILEIRLSILYDHVDVFNIIESDYTFSNKYKGYNFEKYKQRFAKWLDKINYIKVESPKYPVALDNEHWHFEQLRLGFQNVQPDDLVLMCRCVDEIPRPEAIELMKNTDYQFYNLYFPIFFFKFNYMDTIPENGNWTHYWTWGKAFKGNRCQGNLSPIGYFTAIPGDKSVDVHHAGWHFSYLGDENWIKNKITSFSHTELDIPSITDNIDINKHISDGEDCLNRKMNTFRQVNFDSYFPKYLLDNREKYNQFILPDLENGQIAQDYHGRKILELVEH